MNRFAKFSFVILVAILGTNLNAAEVSWPEEPVSLLVQDQALPEFLKDLGALTDVRLLPSDKVDGRISGRFDGKPVDIFRKVAKAYGLLSYYDGTALHVSSAAELQSRSLQIKPVTMERVLEALVARDLVTRDHKVEFDRQAGVVRLRGAPEFVGQVETLILALQPAPAKKPKPLVQTKIVVETPIASNELTFRTFRLNYASAADVTLYQNGRDVTIPGVASLLRTMLGDGQQLPGPSVYFNQPSDPTVPGLRGKGLSRFENVNSELESPKPTAKRSVASGMGSDIRIVAEPNLNAVIVRDTAASMPLYDNLIQELDKEPQLIEIQVTIVDMDKNTLRDIGVDWNFESGSTNAQFGGGEVVDQNGGLALNTVLGDAGRFLARVNALAETGQASITSRPQVLTLSNLEAVLSSDEEFFVRIAGNEEVDLFNVSAGTSLRVLPNIVGSPDDPQIRLLVTIEDGAIDTTSSVDGIPIVERSSLNTQAIIYDGESLLLGGLVRESESVTTTQVPLLGSIPAVGKLFQRETQIESQTERLFVISPRLAGTNRRSPPATSSSPALMTRTMTDEQLSEDYVEGF